MTHPIQRIIDLAIAALLGGAMFAVGRLAIHDPLGLALWSAVAAIALLPISMQDRSDVDSRERLSPLRYAFAIVPSIVGIGVIIGWMPATILAAVAGSLIGGASLLTAVRVPTTYAIAITILGAALSFTWPIWGAGLLATHDFGLWPQRVIDVSPAFAINTEISPEDALTHRPIAYRLMNLGQDVSYTMPRSVWPCVALHAGMGIVGLVAISASEVRMRNRDRAKRD